MERTITRLSWKKGLFCTFLFTGLLALTAFLFLKGQDLGQLLRVLRQTHVPWLIVGGSCMVFFFCCEALNIQRGLRIFGSHALDYVRLGTYHTIAWAVRQRQTELQN